MLGDPEQSPRCAVPQVLRVTHPTSVMANVAASFDVVVTTNGTAFPGALVALVLDPTEYHTALTDSSGIAHFAFVPQAPQGSNQMTVTVSHQNALPYQGTIQIDTSCVTVTVPPTAREGDGILAGQGQVTLFPAAATNVTVALA